MGSHLDAAEVLTAFDQFRVEMEQWLAPTAWLVEVPFTFRTPTGQRVNGFIDLALETGQGWVVIDHKSFPGSPSQWTDEALGYSGQLACYREALTASGRRVASTWIHFPVGGGLLEVTPPEQNNARTVARE